MKALKKVTPVLGPKELLLGGLAALENCTRLSEDAKLLFAHQRFASAITLATFAREELGRYELILERFQKIDPDGSIAVDDLNKLCEDHVRKLDRGQSVTSVSLSAARLAAFQSAAASGNIEAMTEAMDDVHVRNKAKRKKDPYSVHVRRARSLYADALPNGEWNRPGNATEDEARVLVHTVCSEYANVVLRYFNNAALRAAFDRHEVVLDLARLQGTMVVAMKLPMNGRGDG